MQTDEYVMLDKITGFRQDIQMSAIIKIITLFVKVWENDKIRVPLTLVSLWNCAHKRSLEV